MGFKFKTTPQRSRIMRGIKAKETKPEILLRKALWNSGIRYRKNYIKVPGCPDIAIVRKKIAIFVDGEFWHGYKWHQKKKKIKANRRYWIPKIERTIKRDLANVKLLKKIGWRSIRFWDFQAMRDIEECTKKIISVIQKNSK